MNECRTGWAVLPGLLICFLTAAAPAQSLSIRGQVFDAASADPIYRVDIGLVGTGHRATTDRDGRFAFPDLAPGTYTLRATRLGYEDAESTVTLGAGADAELAIPMSRRVVPLEEITVTPGAYAFIDKGGAGRLAMSREEIESVPQLGEDVFRAVNRLPGLSSGDYSAHFGIRGGRHDETLIELDGIELYEPFHLKDFNEGAISIIDAETIEGVELMTGGFPAEFGNKRSGVFKIRSRRPRLDHARYSVGASFLNARALAMGPLADGRGSWLVSARSGYMDLVFGLINQNELPSPRYYDVFAKTEYVLSSRHTLSLDVLHAGDRYEFNAKSTTGFQDSIRTREQADNRYGNSYAWTTLESALGDRTIVKTLLSAGLVTRNRDGTEFRTDTGLPFYAITNERDFSILGAKQDWRHVLTDSYILSYGADFRRFHNKDRFSNVVEQDPNDPSPDPDDVFPIRKNTSVEDTGNRLALYLSNRVRVVTPLVIDVGGRWDRATWTDDSDLSPRVSAALDIGGGRTVRGGWGYYRQIQGIDDVAALNANLTFFPSELTEQWTAGVEQTLANGAVLRVEGYYKEGSDLRPVLRNWKGGIDTFPETNEDRFLVFPETVTAKGLEVYLDHEVGEKVRLRASYALSKAEETVRDMVNVNEATPLVFDRKHPIPADQRHAVNLDATYKLARLWKLHGSLGFHTGWLATFEEMVPVVRENGAPDFTIRPLKIYGERLPSYIRFDVRATRRWTTPYGDWRFFMELVNLSNHGNVFGYDYFKTRDGNGNFALQREEETWFTILPSLGVSWSGDF